MLNPADTAFVLLAAALVLLMTPGLALFYGGLVRRKNVVAIMAQSFLAMGLVTVAWTGLGFSLAFGPDHGGFIGGLDYLGLLGVGVEPKQAYGPTIPFLAFFAFQLMFAIITPALITGAFADRMRLKAYVAFVVLWSLVVYAPLAHWVWGGGFLQTWGVRDFAGGIVVHLSAGFGALAAIIVIGPRRLNDGENPAPHSVPLMALGAGLLWFGWFGFNAGSALAANEVAAFAFVNTMLAAAAGLVTWMVIAWLRDGRPGLVGGLTGAVAGLAAVTPASGFVSPRAALAIGVAASVVCYTAVLLRSQRRWDDSLDVWAIHGVGGALGVALTGVFASTAVNVASGLFEGNPAQLGLQLAGVVIAIMYSFGVTYALLVILRLLMPLRVTADDEGAGLDLVLHGEKAYGES